MLWAQPDNPLIWVAKAGTIPFFIFHYGMFTTVHGVVVLTLFGGVNRRGFPGPSTFLHAVQAAGLWPHALALAASHGVSFAFNYIGAGEYRTAALAKLMTRPYGRVMVLHVVILGGGFLVQALGAPLAAVAVLVVLKTGLDLGGHLREHAAPRPPTPGRPRTTGPAWGSPGIPRAAASAPCRPPGSRARASRPPRR